MALWEERRFYIECGMCDSIIQIKEESPIEVVVDIQTAEAMAKKRGWVKGRGCLWFCPQCSKKDIEAWYREIEDYSSEVKVIAVEIPADDEKTNRREC